MQATAQAQKAKQSEITSTESTALIQCLLRVVREPFAIQS